MRTTKLLLTIVLITAFLAESTGAGCLHLSELTKQDSLRPAASAQNGLLLVKRFIGGENAAGGGISRTAEISILVNELLQCNSLIDGDALLSDKLLGIQKSLDAVISSKIDAISHTTKEEALRLKTDIEQLRERQTKDEQRLTQDEKGGTKKQKISLLKTVRTAAEVLSVVGILIFVASYFNNYCLLLAKLHPLLFCVLVAFITSLTGDYLRQRINIFRGLQDSIDKRHILRFGIVYSVISGFAIGYLWHNLSPIAKLVW